MKTTTIWGAIKKKVFSGIIFFLSFLQIDPAGIQNIKDFLSILAGALRDVWYSTYKKERGSGSDWAFTSKARPGVLTL